LLTCGCGSGSGGGGDGGGGGGARLVVNLVSNLLHLQVI